MVLLGVAISVGNTAADEGGSATRHRSTRVRQMQQSPTASSNAKIESNKKSLLRLREGTVINDQSGYFREDGEGATFVAATGLEFGALPNLNLERVVGLIKGVEKPSSIRWSVTGSVTEFGGRNFLLISRVVYKSASPPPTPELVVQ